MIDEEATYKKFGYHSTDWKRESHKLIIAVCDDCGKVRELNKRKYRGLCPSCVRKGRTHSEVTRHKMSVAKKGISLSEEHKRKLSDANKGENGYWYGKHLSKEHRRKVGAARKGEKHPMYGKTGERSPRWKGATAKCAECGTIFHIKPSNLKNGGNNYCSVACYGRSFSKNYQGEHSSQWKGGVSFEPYCSKFNNCFKNYIRNKFDNVCFLCGKTTEKNGKALSVHHVNGNKNCGCDQDLTCQFVPLCMSCHSKVHINKELETTLISKLSEQISGWYI